MAETAADVIVDTLRRWGIDTVFGMPGDGINGLMESLRRRQDEVRFIQVRHEEAAAFMACAYAKYTGRVGCCMATSGPGGIHLLGGLYDAKLDGQPVVAITGLHFHDLIGTFAQQDVALDKLFMDVAVYNERVMGPGHAQALTDAACRAAVSERGVAHITVPVDTQDMEMPGDVSKRNEPSHYGVRKLFARAVPVPETSALAAAAKVINEGERVAILAGRGALHAAEALESLADKVAGPVIKALLGKAVLPDDSPYTTGCHGLLGTRPSQEAIEQCDTLLMIGSSFPYIEFLPEPGQARAVQIDLDPVRLGLRHPVEVGLVGDSRATLQALLPHIERKSDRSFLETAQAGMKTWWSLMEQRGTAPDTPMKPQVVAWELGKRLRNDAIVACDSGTIATWWARQIPVKRGQMHTLSGTLASMACALPYAIAAQLAHPDRQTVAFIGDGGFTMLMGELLTIAKYALPVKIVVIRNDSLGQIKWEQMVFLGNPEYACDLQPMDFTKFAEACGVAGYRIEDPGQCGEILDRALAEPGPAVIEAVVDTHEPPMPPKVDYEQARNFLASLARGQPDRGRIVQRLLGARVREMI